MLSFSSIKNKVNTISVYFAALVFFAFWVKDANAGLEEDFRRVLVKQVFEEVSDKSLAADIVEIRFRREFEKWKESFVAANTGTSKTQTENAPVEQVKQSVPSSLTVTSNNLNPSILLGIGNQIHFGISSHVSSDFRWRNDIRASSSQDKNRSFNNAAYIIDEANISIGSYLDWFPFERGLRLTAGVNLNHIQTRVLNQPYSPITVNSKTVVAGSNYLDITYKFPKLTPYLGLGIESDTDNRTGWNAYADIGVMVGKYDATVQTNLVGVNGINKQDVTTEVEALRDSLYRKKYLPVGAIGLKYKF